MTTEQTTSINSDTWPKVLKYNYEKFGDKSKAMRHKDFGIWNVYTWKDYYNNVKYFALGLLSLGFERGDSLLVIGDNSPECYFAEMSAQANRGISVGAYPDASISEIKYFIENSKSKFVIAQDQEQIDKLMQIINELPMVKNIIYWTYKGLAHYHNPILQGYREVVELGKDFETHNPGVFESNINAGKGEDISNIIYTSGTEGSLPKGVIHTYKSIRASVERLLETDSWNQNDDVVLQSPPVGINELFFGIGCHLLSASVLNFAESPETQLQDYREIGPDIVFYTPRLWEYQATTIQNRLRDADSLSRFFYRLCVPIGYKVAESKYKKKSVGIFSKIWYSLAYILIMRQLKDNLGLPNVRLCYSSGAWLDPEVIKFYHALNIPLKNIYCSTEGGALSGARASDITPDTLGTIHKGIELKIGDNSEMSIRSDGLFIGYQDAQQPTKIKDGWYFSGDAGSITNDRQLIFHERIADLIGLKNGQKCYPQLIESKLRSSPFISDAWVTGGPDGSFISAVIVINYDRVGKWAGLRKLAYTNFIELSQKSEVYELIKHEITKINEILPPNYRIAKWAHLHKEFNPEAYELTRNRKINRTMLNEHYDQIINALYSGKSEVDFNTHIKNRDGRFGVTTTNIKIKTV